MNKTMMTFLLIVLTLSQAFASVPLNSARKSATGKIDMYGCMHANDYYIVNFAAYPVSASTSAKPAEAECVNLPATGKASVTLDLLDRDLRHKEVHMKIFNAAGSLIAETPPAVIKQGVLSTQVDFNAAGNYQAVLYVNDTDLKIDAETGALHIPLTVAVVGAEPAAQNVLTGFFILLAVLIISLAIFLPRLLKPGQPVQPH